MSKKKSSTMTLRDFHGGNIPSELPLPSAPGMVVERKNHDRPGSGGWMGSSLHRAYSGERVGFPRLGSGNFTRSYEEKISYLPNPANIGRNYDEDERRPVEGHNRRGQSSEYSEEAIFEQRQVGHDRAPERHNLDNRGGLRERYPQEESSPATVITSVFRMDSIPRHTSVYQESSSQPFVSQDHASHFSMRAAPHSPYHTQEPGQPWRQSSLGQPHITPGTIMGSGTGVQNVWTARKDVEYDQSYPADYTINDAATMHTSGSRIAQASALEKVSSGRWNSRSLQSPNESQFQAGDYGPFEGGGSYPSHDNTRFPSDYDRAEYADRSAFVEAGRGVDSMSLRDSRLYPEKGNLYESRKEHFSEGRGAGNSEPNRYVGDRHAYNEGHAFGEIGQKGIVASKEAARSVGSRDGAFSEGGQSKLINNRFNTNEGVPYPDPRSSVQSSSGWVRPEPLSKREYGEGISIDANMGPSSEFEKIGFSGRDSVTGRDISLSHRSHAMEIPKEQFPHADSSYHMSGKDETGYLNSPHPKSRDDLSQEAPGSYRSGRLHDRNRGLDIDQNQPGRFFSPGSVHTSPYDNVGATISSPVDDGKGPLVERPKLKLLPRTKPLQAESLDDSLLEAFQEDFEVTAPLRAEVALGYGSGTSPPLVSTEVEEPTGTIERPKLSLRPRSQPVDVGPGDSGSLKERMSLFGGARPRELVLRERGIDESFIGGADLTSNVSPSPTSGVRTPLEGHRTTPGGLSYGVERPEKVEERSRRPDQHETRTGRQDSGRLDRLDSRGRRERNDFDKKDDRRGSEQRHHSEKRESERLDVDKQESWRRPLDLPQSPVPGGEVSSGVAGRPIQSAAELAQAFSRSTSLGSGPGASAQGYASQRSPGLQMPGLISGVGSETPGLRKTDVPFSRLTETLSPGSRDFHNPGVQAGYRRTSAF